MITDFSFRKKSKSVYFIQATLLMSRIILELNSFRYKICGLLCQNL